MRSLQVIALLVLVGLALAVKDRKNVIQVVEEPQQKKIILEATPKLPGATLIYNGNQITNNINSGDVQYYYATIESWMLSNSTTIYVIGTYVDVYAAVGYTPNTTNYEWGQSGYNSYKYLYLTGSDFTSGTLQIAIYGRYTSSSFTLVFLSGSTSYINYISEPTPGSVSTGSYQFYQVSVSSYYTTNNLAIFVGGNGDADIFASMTIQRPERNDYTWSSTASGNDTLVISSTDPNFSAGTLYVAVYGYSCTGGCNYIINVYPNLPSTTLSNGIQVNSQHVLQYSSAYYNIATNGALSNQSIGISASVTVFGELQTYASFTCTRPSPYCSTYYAFGGLLQIPPTDPNYVINAPLYVGVYAYETSIFDIVGLIPATTTVLVMGVPTPDSASANQYRFYSFVLDSAFGSTAVSISTTSSYSTLYASLTTARPMGSGTWSSTSGSLTIPAGAIADGATLYISELSTYSNSYTITANIGTVTPTVNDTAYPLTLGAGYTWYSIAIPSDYCTVSISVNSGYSIYIYASQQYTRPYQNAYSWYGYNTLQTNAAYGVQEGTLYFSLYNYYQTSASVTLETIVVDFA